jgi:acyl-CoA reductase-like NAD-dependent aldehyde dehydrogenase
LQSRKLARTVGCLTHFRFGGLTISDVDIAVKAARKAFNGVWKETAPSTRGAM